MPAKSFYGSPTKTFLEMPTTLLQVLRRTFGRLRDSRKSPGIYFGVCGSPAGLPAFALAFAGVPQVSRHLLWRLRGVPQVLRRTCWPLQHAINDILYMNKGISFFCRTHAVRHRYQAIQGQSVREKDTVPAIHALPPRKKEYPDRSALRQNAGKSDQTLRIINHLRARSNSAFREAWRPVGRVDISISLRPVKKMIIKNEG